MVTEDIEFKKINGKIGFTFTGGTDRQMADPQIRVTKIIAGGAVSDSRAFHSAAQPTYRSCST